MESYPQYFSCSSATPAADPSSSLSLNMANYSLAYNDQLQGSKSNGFLGLMSEMDVNNPVSNINVNNPQSRTNCVVSESNGHDHAKSGKKKGEKKVRKPRYAFQTRSQVDILDDGYRWRKYGQKAVKNNKYPRSYYRCTHQGCNVKKQVQRLTKDEEIVVTTYEGMHSHPIERSTDNFEHILSQMQIYTTF